jgi:hypothetical protein
MAVNDGDVLRATVGFYLPELQVAQNTFWFECQFADSQAEEDVYDAIDTYLSTMYDYWDIYMENSVTMAPMRIDKMVWNTDKWEVSANVGSGAWGSTLVPADGSDSLPAGTAHLGFFDILTAAKHQGKKFFAGFCEDMNGPNGGASATLNAAIVEGITELLTPYVISAGNSLVHVIADFLTGAVREPTGVHGSGVWAYQRRRRPGSGS